MTLHNPHIVALRILEESIEKLLTRRGYTSPNNPEYDQLSSQIGQLRTTCRMIRDSSISVPLHRPAWFEQFANQLADLERNVTKPEAVKDVPPPGPVTLTVPVEKELTGYVRRDSHGILVMDLASGAVIPVHRLHFGQIITRSGNRPEDAVIYNYEPESTHTPIRILTESAAYMRSAATIYRATLKEIPLPE